MAKNPIRFNEEAKQIAAKYLGVKGAHERLRDAEIVWITHPRQTGVKAVSPEWRFYLKETYNNSPDLLITINEQEWADCKNKDFFVDMLLCRIACADGVYRIGPAGFEVNPGALRRHGWEASGEMEILKAAAEQLSLELVNKS